MKQAEEQDKAPVFRQAWLLTFGDLLTLMLCFFIALCSFQRFGPQDGSVSDSNYRSSSQIATDPQESKGDGTTFAVLGGGGPLPGVVLTERDFRESVLSLSEDQAQELSQLALKVLTEGLSLEIETCSQSLSQESLNYWEASVQRMSFLQDLLVEQGVPERVIRTRVLGPHCELLETKKQNARVIVRAV